MRRLIFAAVAALALSGLARSASAQTRLPQEFSFQSPLGTYDKTDLQVGFAVYQANCASCHGLGLVHYRDLRHLGLAPQDIAAVLAKLNAEKSADPPGKAPLMARDTFRAPFPDDAAAAAKFHGAIPPDLSLIERGHKNGADYIYSLLMGYRAAPPDVTMLPGHYYNVAFPGLQTAMPPALKPGSVTLADGKKPSVQQMAHDVAAFLAWTANPTLDERKAVGLRIILFLIVLGIFGGLALRSGRRV
ncbi:MAG TPA: cytochrome c1 [Acidiphilium sp.]